MEDPQLLEWIDRYLLGTISPEDRVHLEARIDVDPEAATLFRESKDAFLAIQYAREKHLRKQVMDWDQEATHGFRVNRKRTILFLGLSLGLLLLLFIAGMSYYFSPATMAARFSILDSFAVEEHITEEKIHLWHQAVRHFHAGEFSEASSIFSAFLDRDDKQLTDCAIWHMLLCEMNLSGINEMWKERVENFSKQAAQPYQAKAVKLNQITHSFFFQEIYERAIEFIRTYIRPGII